MGLREPPDADGMLPADTFAGRTAIVTGGGTGLGLAMATALGLCGARIGIISRSTDTGEAGLSALRARGIECAHRSADVRDAVQVEQAFDELTECLGLPTMLANNAGANFPQTIERLSLNGFRAISRIALNGTYHASLALVRRLRAARQGGAIINNAATYAWTGLPGGAASAAAKAATLSLTRTAAERWRADGIRVNAIAAGFFPHPHIGQTQTEHYVAIGRILPGGRPGRMRELGWLAAYLCSPWADCITGQVLTLDGGDWLRRSLNFSEFTPPRLRRDAWAER